MTKRFTKIDMTQQHFEQRLDMNVEAIKEVKAEIVRLSEKMDKRFDKVDEQFAKVDEWFAKVDERFAKVDERFDKIEARFNNMDKRFAKKEVFYPCQCPQEIVKAECAIKTASV